MARRLLLLAAGLALAGCATDPGVVSQQARRTPPGTAATAPPTTAAPPTDDPSSTAPPGTDPGGTVAPVDPAGDIDFGDAKQPRAYDEFVQAALADLQRWWAEIYPDLYGEAFEPLSGGIYAAYPQRNDPIPGCGTSRETTYAEVHEYAAFYCAPGDFMVYDDGDDGILFDLAEQFGPSILGVVLAHEFGHAVQTRAGVLTEGQPTIFTEQQADCFAGAWVARASRGEATGVSFSDTDVRNGLIAMITVRDPVGLNQFSAGGHGSAFDRIGAFQAGFLEGPGRCVDLIDDPLPLAPNEFVPGTEDERNEGNLPFGYDDGQIVHLIVNDLNAFWVPAVESEGGRLEPLTVTPVQSAGEIDCDDLAADFTIGAALCPGNDVVFLDEPRAIERHTEFGDFSVGFVLGTAWTEAVQRALDSSLTGEDRALADDCLVGAWTATLVPDEQGRTPRDTRISPGDLDEAIRTALVVGDEHDRDDVRGSGFEKIASFRDGVLGGLDACTPLLSD